MNEIKEIDAIINLYKDDVCDGLRNKLMLYINSHYIAKEKVLGLKLELKKIKERVIKEIAVDGHGLTYIDEDGKQRWFKVSELMVEDNK